MGFCRIFSQKPEFLLFVSMVDFLFVPQALVSSQSRSAWCIRLLLSSSSSLWQSNCECECECCRHSYLSNVQCIFYLPITLPHPPLHALHVISVTRSFIWCIFHTKHSTDYLLAYIAVCNCSLKRIHHKTSIVELEFTRNCLNFCYFEKFNTHEFLSCSSLTAACFAISISAFDKEKGKKTPKHSTSVKMFIADVQCTCFKVTKHISYIWKQPISNGVFCIVQMGRGNEKEGE